MSKFPPPTLVKLSALNPLIQLGDRGNEKMGRRLTFHSSTKSKVEESSNL